MFCVCTDRANNFQQPPEEHNAFVIADNVKFCFLFEGSAVFQRKENRPHGVLPPDC